MDILGFLSEKTIDTNQVTHPFAYKDNKFKYLYCFGLGVMSYGHMKAITETKETFSKILTSIKLPTAYQDKIIVDINNNFDYKINDVFSILDTKEKQYTFTADLLMLSNKTLWAQEYCEKVRINYWSIFKFSSEEKRFFLNYTMAAARKDMAEAVHLYHEFIKEGYRISYTLLKYISEDILLEESYENIHLNAGEKFIIDKPSIIKGDVYIANGAALVVKHTQVKINGSITVDGGRLVINGVRMMVVESSKDTLITINNTARVCIDNLEIDCNFKCGFITQRLGRLIINNSIISHTDKVRAIEFEGAKLVMNGTTLEDCLRGGVQVNRDGILNIDDCEFYNCKADHGGAIFTDSLYDSTISNSRFTNCVGNYLGGAIYFAYQKYGQFVYRCEYDRCLPEDSIVFNQYEEERL
jgi:hypothetical protein